MVILRDIATRKPMSASLRPVAPWQGLRGGTARQFASAFLKEAPTSQYDQLALTFLQQQTAQQEVQVTQTHTTALALQILLQLNESFLVSHNTAQTLQQQQLQKTFHHYTAYLQRTGSAQGQALLVLERQLLVEKNRREIAQKTLTQLLEGAPKHGALAKHTTQGTITKKEAQQTHQKEVTLQRESVAETTASLLAVKATLQGQLTQTNRALVTQTQVLSSLRTAQNAHERVEPSTPKRRPTAEKPISQNPPKAPSPMARFTQVKVEPQAVTTHKQQLLSALNQVQVGDMETIWQTLSQSKTLTLQQETLLVHNQHLSPHQQVELLVAQSSPQSYLKLLETLRQSPAVAILGQQQANPAPQLSVSNTTMTQMVFAPDTQARWHLESYLTQMPAQEQTMLLHQLGQSLELHQVHQTTQTTQTLVQAEPPAVELVLPAPVAQPEEEGVSTTEKAKPQPIQPQPPQPSQPQPTERLLELIVNAGDLPKLMESWRETPLYKTMETQRTLVQRMERLVAEKTPIAPAALLVGMSEGEGKLLVQHLTKTGKISTPTGKTKALRTLQKVLTQTHQRDVTAVLTQYLTQTITPQAPLPDQVERLYREAVTIAHPLVLSSPAISQTVETAQPDPLPQVTLTLQQALAPVSSPSGATTVAPTPQETQWATQNQPIIAPTQAVLPRIGQLPHLLTVERTSQVMVERFQQPITQVQQPPVTIDHPSHTTTVVQQPPVTIDHSSHTTTVVQQPPVTIDHPSHTTTMVQQPPVTIDHPSHTITTVVQQPPVTIDHPSHTTTTMAQQPQPSTEHPTQQGTPPLSIEHPSQPIKSLPAQPSQTSVEQTTQLVRESLGQQIHQSILEKITTQTQVQPTTIQATPQTAVVQQPPLSQMVFQYATQPPVVPEQAPPSPVPFPTAQQILRQLGTWQGVTPLTQGVLTQMKQSVTLEQVETMDRNINIQLPGQNKVVAQPPRVKFQRTVTTTPPAKALLYLMTQRSGFASIAQQLQAMETLSALPEFKDWTGADAPTDVESALAPLQLQVEAMSPPQTMDALNVEQVAQLPATLQTRWRTKQSMTIAPKVVPILQENIHIVHPKTLPPEKIVMVQDMGSQANRPTQASKPWVQPGAQMIQRVVRGQSKEPPKPQWQQNVLYLPLAQAGPQRPEMTQTLTQSLVQRQQLRPKAVHRTKVLTTIIQDNAPLTQAPTWQDQEVVYSKVESSQTPPQDPMATVQSAVREEVRHSVAAQLPPLQHTAQSQAKAIEAQQQSIAALEKVVQEQKVALETITTQGQSAVDAGQVQALTRAVMKELDSKIRLERQRRGLT